MENNIFTPEFLKEIGFTLIEEKVGKYSPHPTYGSAKDKIGITNIRWSTEGHYCTYFGEKLEPNTSFEIKKDADTRTAFNGYVFSQDDVRHLLKLTW
jgi:hypothetical protein